MKEKNKVLELYSPLNGTVVPLEEVPDMVFSSKMLGDGAAVLPADGKIYAPVSGTLTTVAETKHAFGFQTEEGYELLVHFGLETVALEGTPFLVRAKVGAENH